MVLLLLYYIYINMKAIFILEFYNNNSVKRKFNMLY